jgi:hypothetical protein
MECFWVEISTRDLKNKKHVSYETFGLQSVYTRAPTSRFADLGCTIRVLGFDSRRGLGIFLFTTASRTALGPTQPIPWVPGSLSLGVKLPGREADHSPQSSAKVKMRGAIFPLPKYAFMAWCSVKKNSTGQFYLLPYKLYA